MPNILLPWWLRVRLIMCLSFRWSYFGLNLRTNSSDHQASVWWGSVLIWGVCFTPSWHIVFLVDLLTFCRASAGLGSFPAMTAKLWVQRDNPAELVRKEATLIRHQPTNPIRLLLGVRRAPWRSDSDRSFTHVCNPHTINHTSPRHDALKEQYVKDKPLSLTVLF